MQATLSAEDTLAVHEVLARYVHIIDGLADDPEGAVAMLGRLVFAEKIIWEGHHGPDVEHLEGVEAVLARYAENAALPFRVDHHVESPLVTRAVDGRVRTRTHFVAVRDDGKPVSGDYL